MSRIVFQKSYIVIFPSYRKTDIHKHPMLHLFAHIDESAVFSKKNPFDEKAPYDVFNN